MGSLFPRWAIWIGISVPPFVSGDFVKIPKKRSQDFILPTVCFHIFRVSDKSIGLFLRYAFTSLYKEVLSKSHSSSMMTVPKFVPRLTKEETRGKQTSHVVLVLVLLPTDYKTNYFAAIHWQTSYIFLEVFESARESMAAFKKWRAGGVRLHKASILGRKRKTKLPDGASTPWTCMFKVSMAWSAWAVYLICSCMFADLSC